MGLFDKKEKNPEEKLVSELVGTGFTFAQKLNNEKISSVKKGDIQKAVKNVWKMGEQVKIYKEYMMNQLIIYFQVKKMQ